MLFVKLFGFLLAVGVVGTSAAMFALGARWQAIESSAYAGKKRPVWFFVVSALVLGLYGVALWRFVGEDKTWAAWVLMVALPALWALKTALVAANPAGRAKVSAISGNENWKKIALARLPVAVVLAALALAV